MKNESISIGKRRRSASEGADKSCWVNGPSNPLITAMLTDRYQVSMAYAYYMQGIHLKNATFDLFFRKCPFGGEFCIFAGLEEVLGLLSTFKFTTSDVESLKIIMPECDTKFWDYLSSLSCKDITVFAQKEGSVVFPREPLLRIEGPLIIGQLLETTLLNLVNFPSLVATCAARMRLAVGPNKKLFEFGLRRAQGPDGALSASKYCYMGGFDGTSNILAAATTAIPCIGTHAHAFVMCYSSLNELKEHMSPPVNPQSDPILNAKIITNSHNTSKTNATFVESCLSNLKLFGGAETNEGELAAFISYAQSFPAGFLALIDTYDTLTSGVVNFIAVAAALFSRGYQPKGIRLDSGDLAYLSKQVRRKFIQADQIFGTSNNEFQKLIIVASNDLNEDVLMDLDRQGHEIDAFGIGTHLVTCQAQPALGCVYKLVEIDNAPRIKLSQEVSKLVIPCSKSVYRLFGKKGIPIVDVIQRSSERAPIAGERILVRHPFEEQKRAHVTPTEVQPLLHCVWAQGEPNDKVVGPLNDSRDFCLSQLRAMREDHIRVTNPTPYKISVSSDLYNFMHELWMAEAPISDLA